MTAKPPKAIVARYTTEYESLYALDNAAVAAVMMLELTPGTPASAVALPPVRAGMKVERELLGSP